MRRRTVALAVCAALLALSLPARADATELPATRIAPPHERIRPGERLSDWLLRQPPRDDDYGLGLSWRVPAQALVQAKLRQRLLADLAVSADIRAPAAARERMAAWLESLPATGRAPLARSEARWLQAHPASDPVLEEGHTLHRSPRPSTVTVITATAERCDVTHRAGAQSAAYLRACHADRDIDFVWIVQADGHMRRLGIAPWNEESQDEVAPGAWLWAPARGAGWPEGFSARLAHFLATQGPARDAAQTPTALPTRPAGPLIVEPAARNLAVSASDWGEIGLLQTPTARMAPPGEIRFNFSRVYPYGRGNLFLQPFDWLEAGFRYTNISNRLYGSTIAGDQANKDKSIDFKLRLAKETAWTPELALGVVDMGGTGLFSGEYLVASKRTGNFDWSLGIGWGYLGARGNQGNPVSSLLGNSFDRRSPTNVGSGGTVATENFFRGRTSLFGGVQYQTPWEGLLLKAEIDGNDYQHEPQGNNRRQSSPLNLGLTWRYSPSVDISAGVERGNTAMLGFTFHGQLDAIRMPKLLDPPKPAVAPLPPAATPRGPDWEKTAADLKAQTLWTVREIRQQGGDLFVVFDRAKGIYWNERVERAAAVLHRDAPAAVTRFILSYHERGMPMAERVVFRDAWVAEQTRLVAPADRRESLAGTAPRPLPQLGRAWHDPPDRLTGGLAPSFRSTIGGPDGFILYSLGVSASAEFKLSEHTWIGGNLNWRAFDNYSNFKYTAPSNLPRVRTYMREYLTTSAVTLPNLQLTHAGRIGDDQFFSLYGGLLESMYAGVGGEWLYRPWHSRLAFGIDINRVQQRAFEQDFKLRDYQVTTGHATLYLDTGWQDIQLGLSAGQYLAGDRGITLDASRSFSNGVKMGAYATKTNVSSATFGEGSFDKGIYISIPFDAMLPRSSPSTATFAWSPLTRDGGAKLAHGSSLYGLTSARDVRLMGYEDAGRRTAGNENGTTDGEWSFWGDLGGSAADLARQLATPQTGSALLTGGAIVLGSALLDKSVDRWAVDHASGNWETVGKAANGIPYLLATGAGLLSMGLGGDADANTAWTSIKAAGFTLIAETLTKAATGRARPEENLGASHFTGPSAQAANSSFPSIHTGVAFALVTPFAEQYDAPWLYALAGATAFGRIQQRQHFVSDTVAGSLIGYGIGHLLLDQQRTTRRGPRISVGANRSIQAAWDF